MTTHKQVLCAVGQSMTTPGTDHYIRHLEDELFAARKHRDALKRVADMAVCPDCGCRDAGTRMMSMVPCGHQFHTALTDLKGN